jgi:glycosyltransferase involved in cell wall biosynthesis
VALVHDFLVDVRGAERVFFEICDLYPEADVYSPIYDRHGTEGRLGGREVHTSFLQRVHPGKRTFRGLLPLYPAAIRSFDLAAYELVISSSSAWAHAVRVADGATHVCYCHNPFRYAWNERDATLAARRSPLIRRALGAFLDRWRDWDRQAARRVDAYLANSHTTQRRVRECFGRESAVVHPPVDTRRFARGEIGDHHLVLSALMAHKRIDVAIEAFNRLGLPLVVAGAGPDEARLRSLAGPTISFAGRVDDERAAQLLASARAVVVPSVEEFGIVAVEAQAAGRPVLAVGEGGALETVVDGETGALWRGVDGLVAAVLDYDADGVDPEACVASARRFDSEVFRVEFERRVRAALEDPTGVASPNGHDRHRAGSGGLVEGGTSA